MRHKLRCTSATCPLMTRTQIEHLRWYCMHCSSLVIAEMYGRLKCLIVCPQPLTVCLYPSLTCSTKQLNRNCLQEAESRARPDAPRRSAITDGWSRGIQSERTDFGLGSERLSTDACTQKTPHYLHPGPTFGIGGSVRKESLPWHLLSWGAGTYYQAQWGPYPSKLTTAHYTNLLPPTVDTMIHFHSLSSAFIIGLVPEPSCQVPQAGEATSEGAQQLLNVARL